MVQSFLRLFTWVLVVILFQASPSAGQQNANPATTEGDFVVKNFKFRSGETLPELRLHYTTLGKPVRDAQGRVINAVLILHGTGGSGHQFLQPIFAGELFGAHPGNVDGLHAFLRVGRDLSRFYGCAYATGLPAGADRRTQPHLAKNGDGRDSQRSRMEGWRVLRGTATSDAHGPRSVADCR